MRSRGRAACDGFTLIEVMVALALSSVAVLIAAQTFGGVSDGLERMLASARDHDEEARARAWLWQAFGGARASTGDGRFVGTTDSVSFRSSLWVPTGWTEEERVTVATRDGTLALRHGARTIGLFEALDEARFAYLPHSDSIAWLEHWESLAGPPVAVRLEVRRGDTVSEMYFLTGVVR